MSDSVAKLLVLPIWATISTSVLYLMVFLHSRTVSTQVKMPENSIVADEITLNCLYVAQLLLLPVLVDFYFRFAYAVMTSEH